VCAVCRACVQSDAEFLASTYLTQTLEGLSQRRYVIHDPASYAASSKQREAATPARPAKAHARDHDGAENEEGEEEENEDDDDNNEEEEEEEEQGRGKRDDRPVPAPATAAGGSGSQPPKAPKAIDLQCSGLTCATLTPNPPPATAAAKADTHVARYDTTRHDQRHTQSGQRGPGGMHDAGARGDVLPLLPAKRGHPRARYRSHQPVPRCGTHTRASVTAHPPAARCTYWVGVGSQAAQRTPSAVVVACRTR
jgi:hypothetical protein